MCQRCIQAPVVFGDDRNLVVFSAKWLDQQVERADPELRRILHDRVAELDAQQGAELPLRVCAVIRESLLAGDVSRRHVATRLASSPRTLARRLADFDTTFDVLLDETRHEMACHLLESSTGSMTQIADVLGYAHSSALSRAFQRWAKTSPRDWRAHPQRGDRTKLVRCKPREHVPRISRTPRGDRFLAFELRTAHGRGRVKTSRELRCRRRRPHRTRCIRFNCGREGF